MKMTSDTGPAPVPALPLHTITDVPGHLADLAAAFRGIRAEAHALLDACSAEQLDWSPEPGRWSVLQCLDHLVNTGAPLISRMDEALQKAVRKRWTQQKSLSYGWFERGFIGMMDPETTRKMKAPRMYAPGLQLDAGEVIRAFDQLQDDLASIAEAGRTLDVRRLKIPSPTLNLLRLSLPAWLMATLTHERRHLRQARAVTEHPDFPGAAL